MITNRLETLFVQGFETILVKIHGKMQTNSKDGWLKEL